MGKMRESARRSVRSASAASECSRGGDADPLCGCRFRLVYPVPKETTLNDPPSPSSPPITPPTINPSPQLQHAPLSPDLPISSLSIPDTPVLPPRPASDGTRPNGADAGVDGSALRAVREP